MSVLSLLLAGPLAFACSGTPADRIFHNGEVLTLDAAGTRQQAVAIRAGKIVCTGSDNDMRPVTGSRTQQTDLKGRTLLPGFYAAHDHFPAAGMVELYYVDLNSPPVGPVETMQDMVGALVRKAAATPKGAWIIGRGYDDTLLREQRHPTRADLDRVSIDHPIWITHTSGHLGVGNSKALAIAGIRKDTVQPAGGKIRKAAGGEPNGVIEESLGLVTRHIPPLGEDQRIAAIAWSSKHYLARGVTTTVIANGSRSSISDLNKAHTRGLLQLRVVSMLSGGADVPPTVREAELLAPNRERVRIGAIKLLQDGSLQGYTGYLTARYHHQPEGHSADDRGYPARSREALIEAVNRYHRGGYQIAIHGNGDAAIDDILEAFAAAQSSTPRQDARHRIEHCQTPRPDQLDRMKQLGVTPSFFEAHVFYWGDRHRDIFLGPERAARISPLATALRKGLRFTLHNDTPVTPVDPLHTVWCAVNRLTRNGRVLGGEERISVVDALRAVTSTAAWQNFEEREKGTIEAGKLADFVIVSGNPLRVAAEKIKDLVVEETIVAGESVYKR